ncbi:MAG TPA: hypothetical protein PKA70_03545 [Saprospiraceae bacterium]|nr:hypothetical protein [Saprospiraceae bacterium]
MKNKMCLFGLLGLLILPKAVIAQDLTKEVMDAIHEKLAREMEENFFSNGDTVAFQGEEEWADFFRTSDLEGEDAIGYSPGLLPPRGVRVGCICMDGSPSDERGRGACSGFGGVRFWLYQVTEDSVAVFPTSRHKQHPEPLSVMELNNLSSRNAFATEAPAKRRNWYDYRIEDVLIAMMVCVTIAYVAKMWFKRD